MPYSKVVYDHFFNPRNVGRMENPDVIGKAGEPGNGPFMLLFLKVSGNAIVQATYQTYGCGPAIAAGSLLTERISGTTCTEARRWTEEAIHEALGGLPPEKRHCSALAATALDKALSAWPGGTT